MSNDLDFLDDEYDCEVVPAPTVSSRRLTVTDVSSGRYDGKLNVRISSIKRVTDRNNQPYLEVDFVSTADHDSWSLIARYFNLTQASKLARATGVNRLRTRTLTEDFVGKLVSIEVGVRRSKDGQEFASVQEVYPRTTSNTLEAVSSD